MDKVTFVCVYKTGPKFNPDSVHLLRRQVEYYGGDAFNFLCITDHEGMLRDFPEWTLELARKNVEGWWCLPEKFRITGPVMFTGIDTVICGDLLPFAEVAIDCPEDVLYMIHAMRIPNKHRRIFANGILLWNGNHKWFYKNYNYVDAKENYILEQDYTTATFILSGYDIRVIQNHVTGVYSWKVHLDKSVDNIPEDARVILFHGKEKPHLENKGKLGKHVRRFSKDDEQWPAALPVTAVMKDKTYIELNLKKGQKHA